MWGGCRMSESNDLIGAGIDCGQCGDQLWFDGTGCFCINKDCVVYNKYVLVQDKIKGS